MAKLLLEKESYGIRRCIFETYREYRNYHKEEVYHNVLYRKCKPRFTLEDQKQFWHYLKASQYRLGFLVNFGHSGGVEIERKIYDTARHRTSA